MSLNVPLWFIVQLNALLFQRKMAVNNGKELSIIRSTTNLFVILLKFNFVGIKNIKLWSQ